MAAEGEHAEKQRKTQASGVNGAAAGWPRKGPAGFENRCVLWRQWGRGRMAAEGFLRDAFDIDHPKRQWGRGRMAAEGNLF